VNDDLSTDQLNGAMLCVTRPGQSGDRHLETVVLDTTANTIVISDAGLAIAIALWDSAPISDFAVLNFNDSSITGAPDYHTYGTWSANSSYDAFAEPPVTTFTDAQADDSGPGFQSWMVGCYLIPDVNIEAPLLIYNVPSATTLEVLGDADSMGASGVEYMIVIPPFMNPETGALQVDPAEAGTRYLWAGYKYMPAVIGVYVDPDGPAGLDVYGKQTGSNKLGQYYAWNRTYDINTGRWTTPDPLATPWWSLIAASSSPVSLTDPSGLFSIDWRFRESLDGEDGQFTELEKAAKNAGGSTDVDNNSDEDDTIEALENTDENDVFVYHGHSADTDGDGKPDTLMDHDSKAGCIAAGAGGGAAVGAGLGGWVGGPWGAALGGLVGGAVGAAGGAVAAKNDPIDKQTFEDAAKKAKGVIIIAGCKGCDLKFENAKCVICYKEEVSVKKSMNDLEAIAKVINDIPAGKCKTWTAIVKDAMTRSAKVPQAVANDLAEMTPSDGCKNAKLCK